MMKFHQKKKIKMKPAWRNLNPVKIFIFPNTQFGQYFTLKYQNKTVSAAVATNIPNYYIPNYYTFL